MKFQIEIDWKPGIRKLWAGVGDIVSDESSAWNTQSQQRAEWFAQGLRHKNSKVIAVFTNYKEACDFCTCADMSNKCVQPGTNRYTVRLGEAWNG